MQKEISLHEAAQIIAGKPVGGLSEEFCSVLEKLIDTNVSWAIEDFKPFVYAGVGFAQDKLHKLHHNFAVKASVELNDCLDNVETENVDSVIKKWADEHTEEFGKTLAI